MRRLWFLLLIAGCKDWSGDDEYPVVPSNGSNAHGTDLDAFVADVALDDAGQLHGRVCLVKDLRTPTTGCAATGALGITVTLGTAFAMTDDAGAFAITLPSGSNLTWRATGANIIPSVMSFGASATVPAILDSDYVALALANGIVPQAGQGSTVARVVKANLPVVGATASIPQADNATKYDGPAFDAWTESKTAAAGTVWIAGIPTGARTLTVMPASSNPVAATVSIEDGAITYITVDLP